MLSIFEYGDKGKKTLSPLAPLLPWSQAQRIPFSFQNCLYGLPAAWPLHCTCLYCLHIIIL